MRMYFKSYAQRKQKIVISVLIVVIMPLISFLIFHNKLKLISDQIENYHNCEYTIQYILNYSTDIENECIFPDTDIQIFKDLERSERLGISSIMKKEGISYNMKCLSCVGKLQKNEICISKSVSEEYEIGIGDTVFCEVPYYVGLQTYKIVDVVDTDFDYTNPNIDNKIGIVYIGYDSDYENHSKTKYLLYSADSKAEQLSGFSQVIDKIINKSTNEYNVVEQSITMYVITLILVIISMVITNIVIFKDSRKYLFRCYLKGIQRKDCILIPLMEKIIILVFPSLILLELILSEFVQNYIVILYKATLLLPYFGYLIVTILKDVHRLRRKGAGKNGSIVN